MDRLIIGIAGGSGSGKSTVAVSLCRSYPERFALLHVDDYFKKKEAAPILGTYKNWDHPDALRLDDLYSDLKNLKEGKAIRVHTKSELYNPGYEHALKNKIEQLIEPRPVIILEGYLALHDPRVRDLLDLKIYLDMSIEASLKRRSLNKFAADDEYFTKVLLPMHQQFVEPTKNYADMVLDASKLDADEVREAIERKIVQLCGD